VTRSRPHHHLLSTAIQRCPLLRLLIGASSPYRDIPFIFMTNYMSHALLGTIATALGRPASPVVCRAAAFRP
jgi:hypothetical protein